MESISFHSEILGETNFGLVLDSFLVNAMILINKTYVKFSRISFYGMLKIPIIITWVLMKKVCLAIIFKAIKMVSYQKSEAYTLTVIKTRWGRTC